MIFLRSEFMGKGNYNECFLHLWHSLNDFYIIFSRFSLYINWWSLWGDLKLREKSCRLRLQWWNYYLRPNIKRTNNNFLLRSDNRTQFKFHKDIMAYSLLVSVILHSHDKDTSFHSKARKITFPLPWIMNCTRIHRCRTVIIAYRT